MSIEILHTLSTFATVLRVYRTQWDNINGFLCTHLSTFGISSYNIFGVGNKLR